jgi:SAM-dependent methyltransferase
MPEDSTHLYYETNARDYFCATKNVDLTPLWADLEKELKPGALILDLGCGSGRDLLHFSLCGFRTVGIDYSLNLLKLAAPFSRQPVVLGDINSLPFNDNTFDAVWAIGSLLHIPRALLPYALLQIRRVLKPGSVFLTSVKKGRGEAVDSRGRYTVFYRQSEWEQLLRENEYEVIKAYESLEAREAGPEGEREITWIVCLARPV